MGEASDRVEDDDGERPDSLEDFRKELHAGDGEESASPPPKEGEVQEVDGRLSDEDLERFRQEILEEYGPDGLGESTPEGQLYNMAREEKEAEAGVSEDAKGAGSGKDATETADGSDNESTAGKEKDAGSEAAVADGDKSGSSEESTSEKGKEAASKVSETGDQKTTGQDDGKKDATESSEQQVTEEAEKGTAPKVKASDGQENPTDGGKANRPDADEEAGEADKKLLEKAEEAKPLPVELESYSRGANQPVVTQQEGAGGPGKASVSRAETSDLQRLQGEGRPEPEEREAGAGPKERVAAVDHTGMRDQGARTIPEQSDQMRSTKFSDLEVDSVGLPRSLETRSSSPRAEVTADTSPFRDSNTAISFAGSAEQLNVSQVGGYYVKASQTTVTGFEPDDKGHGRRNNSEDTDCIRSAMKYMSSTALLVPESVMPPHTKDDVLEVRLTRESESWKVYTLYCKEEPGSGRGYLDLRQLDAKFHERFRIGRVEVYRVDTFSNEYNAKRPKGLENTELLKRDQALVMKVDGREIPLENVVLRSQEGRAVIDARLGNSQVKIANGIGESEIRLKDHSKVKGIKATSEGVILSYQRTNHDPYPHRRVIMEGAPENPHFVKREGPLLIGRVELESRSRGRDSIEFKLRASDVAYEHVFNSLTECRNPDSFKKLKGDIAEEIVKQLGPEIGMRVLADHPFNDSPLKVGSERPGPDLLVSFTDSEGLAYVEIKWWAYKAGAIREAELQILNDLRDHPMWEGKEVRGAYIAVIDWNLENEWFMLTLRRVATESTGRGLK